MAKGRLRERACREMLDDERIDNEWVSEGNTTKTGGEGPYALLQGRGVGRCSFLGAQPVLFRCCFTTVPNLGRPKTTPGVTVQTVCVNVWGEWNRTTPERGVSRQASGNLPDEGDAIPSRPASPHRSAKHVSEWTTGGMEHNALVSRPCGNGARSVNSDDAMQGQ